ncbi:MAG: redoxin protein, partial [Mucilaginibacter sp.]|nr:redoxin protein [Mucilaginibacter sp.]
MLASLGISKNPYFDMTEVTPDLDFVLKPYQSLAPIKAGGILPDFTLQKENNKWQQFFNGAEIHGPVLL